MSVFRGRKYTMLFVIFLESRKISNVEASKGKKKKKRSTGGRNYYIFIHFESLLCNNGMAVSLDIVLECRNSIISPLLSFFLTSKKENLKEKSPNQLTHFPRKFNWIAKKNLRSWNAVYSQYTDLIHVC